MHMYAQALIVVASLKRGEEHRSASQAYVLLEHAGGVDRTQDSPELICHVVIWRQVTKHCMEHEPRAEIVAVLRKSVDSLHDNRMCGPAITALRASFLRQWLVGRLITQ